MIALEHIVVSVALTVIVLAIGTLALFLHFLDRKNCTMVDQWYVELWNICHGYVLQLQFPGAVVLGRSSIYQYASGPVPDEPDRTISMEHCMLYEQNGQIYIGNMSMVNPTVVDGKRVNTPQSIHPGERLEMGRSVFLVTRVVHLDGSHH